MKSDSAQNEILKFIKEALQKQNLYTELGVLAWNMSPASCTDEYRQALGKEMRKYVTFLKAVRDISNIKDEASITEGFAFSVSDLRVSDFDELLLEARKVFSDPSYKSYDGDTQTPELLLQRIDRYLEWRKIEVDTPPPENREKRAPFFTFGFSTPEVL